jgi:hypothetical protein
MSAGHLQNFLTNLERGMAFGALKTGSWPFQSELD